MPNKEQRADDARSDATPHDAMARERDGILDVGSLLVPARVAVDVQVSSKKRLLEELAVLLLKDNPNLDRSTVFQILNERERLGSTGIGEGVALPHGRLNGIDEAIAAVVRLKRPLDFDAVDQEPVSLVFGLLVPAQATETHLELLAALAKMFSDPHLRGQIMRAPDADALYRRIVGATRGADVS